ncbi:hypothetical protein MMC25_003693 [Agyrium rufum]|nr:hypothetical protein [Agyrium rufum]
MKALEKSSYVVLDIVVATGVDLPALVDLNRLAYSIEPIAQLFFENWPDPASQVPYFTWVLENKLRDTNARVLKVVDQVSGEILASVCWTLVESSDDDGGGNGAAQIELGSTPTEVPAPTPPSHLPPGINQQFAKTLFPNIAMVKQHMRGVKHFSLSSLYVSPYHQKKGLGSHVMKYCLKQADEAGIPTFLISFESAHMFYPRFGFEDVGQLVADLKDSEAGGREFGTYRSFAMVRKPKALGP